MAACAKFGENSPIGALNFYLFFIPFLRCQVSGVSVQHSRWPPEAASLIEKETQEFTAEFAENAEKNTLNNLCVPSDLCGESHLGMLSHFM